MSRQTVLITPCSMNLICLPGLATKLEQPVSRRGFLGAILGQGNRS